MALKKMKANERKTSAELAKQPAFSAQQGPGRRAQKKIKIEIGTGRERDGRPEDRAFTIRRHSQGSPDASSRQVESQHRHGQRVRSGALPKLCGDGVGC